jgi:hypothetical protein
MADESSDDQLQQQAWSRLNKIRFVLLTTRDSSGRLSSRPMTLQQSEFDSTLWFFASRGRQLLPVDQRSGDGRRRPSARAQPLERDE